MSAVADVPMIQIEFVIPTDQADRVSYVVELGERMMNRLDRTLLRLGLHGVQVRSGICTDPECSTPHAYIWLPTVLPLRAVRRAVGRTAGLAGAKIIVVVPPSSEDQDDYESA